MGTCTQNDKNILDDYVLGSPNCKESARSLTSIQQWIDDAKKTEDEPKTAAILITYRNAARDLHNFEMAKTFAKATNQEFVLYHAVDTAKSKSARGKKRLQGEAAWRVPYKAAGDLGGRLPLIAGML